MHLLNRIAIATAATAAAAISVAIAVPANADTAAQSGDAVTVGSDTLQNGLDFVADGAPGQTGGYNTLGNVNRIASYDATGDANGRAVYDSTGATLPGSIVLRAGQKPVPRPNGSGQGVAALISDSGFNGTTYNGLPNGSIQFARMSRLPNSTEEGNCPVSSPTTPDTQCNGLHVYQVATDNLAIATAKASYVGPTGLSAQQLVSIYQCTTTQFSQLAGNSAGSTDTIIPLIPQSGSGTRNFFLADLQAANGGNAVNLGSCVKTVQEHDPTGIASQSKPGDAIEPFSTGKVALLNNGYFASGSSNPAYAANYLGVLSGTPGDSNAVYNVSRGLYVTVRQADVASTTPFQPGSTLNFTQELITGANSAFRSMSGQAELKAAGFTPAFKDCLVNPTSC